MLATLLVGPLTTVALFLGTPDANRSAPQDEVSAERLETTLKSIPTKRAPLGDEEHVKGLLDTQALIESGLKEIGYSPTLHEFRWVNVFRDVTPDPGGGKPTGSPRFPATWNNVIAELKGTESPSEVLILGAHFDAVYGTPGADDNATGVAALLEVARSLHGRPLKRTVRFCFFNLEEQLVVGSRSYYESISAKLSSKEEKLIGMISLEMLGYFSDAPDSQKAPKLPVDKAIFDPPTVGDFILLATTKQHQPMSRLLAKEMMAAAPGLKVVPFDFVEFPIPDIMRSDHAAFLINGQPGFMLTDTSNYRNPNYHKPTDSLETLDLKRYTLVVKGVAGAAYAIAQGATPEPAPEPAPASEPVSAPAAGPGK